MPQMVVSMVDVVIPDRMRKELGDIDSLAKSIQENGLICPVTLTMNGDNKPIIVAGHRRLFALKKLGITELLEGEHFKWRGDIINNEYRRTAIELEENIRRKQLNWSEEIAGKQKLLEIYEHIYGPPSGGAITRQERTGLKPQGFGVRKLAELLGESATNTSEDLQLAALVQKLPALAAEPTKEAARRKLELALKIQGGFTLAREAAPLVYKILVTCQSEAHQSALLIQFRAAGLDCKPLVA